MQSFPSRENESTNSVKSIFKKLGSNVVFLQGDGSKMKKEKEWGKEARHGKRDQVKYFHGEFKEQSELCDGVERSL